ncbi:MAG: serine/threonine protein kinase [Myxococcaceae bacterium]
MQPLPEPSPQAPIPFGRYKLMRRIGAGGMGEVFLAREESGPQPRACVVKKVLPNLSENRAFVGRFLDESKVVVRLKHPNIARVYAMGEVKGEYFLAMEYVQGKTVSRFAKRLRDRKQMMGLGQILLLGERVCQGLAYAHDAKDTDGAPLHLVHRDLSPANVCISYRGDVKIIDFGAAQSTLKEEQTAPRVVIGNLTYMAPEQAKKQIVDRRADVYSAGVMLWELLAWHALPQKGDPIERWRRAANPSWEAPSLYRGNLPPGLDAIVLKALAKDPGGRYPNAASFGEELSRLRKKFAPDSSDKDLGAQLSLVFAREKTAEDAVLEATLRGRPLSEVPTDKTRRPVFVPPTALAFEHNVQEAPEELGRRPDETTDPHAGAPPGATPKPATRADLTAVPTRSIRVGFGVSFAAEEPAVEVSLIHEVEGMVSGEEPDEDYHTSTYDTSGRNRFILIAVLAFVGASGLGFGLVWAWLNAHG